MKKKETEKQENNHSDAVEENEIKDTTEEVVDEKEETNDGESDWQEKYNEMNDKYLRLYSEFDNFRKRTQKEKLELYKNAGEDIMLSLLPVLDDFERAEKSMKDVQDTEGIKQGIDLIYQKLIGILNQKGLNAMESPVGQKFDLETQEAVTKIAAPTKDMKGKVIDEVERGYLLNDKVIRFSKVVVGE